MRVQEHRRPARPELFQQRPHGAPAGRVERAGGLVQEEEGRRADERLRDSEPLLHALGHRSTRRRAHRRGRRARAGACARPAAGGAGEPLVELEHLVGVRPAGEAKQLCEVAELAAGGRCPAGAPRPRRFPRSGGRARTRSSRAWTSRRRSGRGARPARRVRSLGRRRRARACRRSACRVPGRRVRGPRGGESTLARCSSVCRPSRSCPRPRISVQGGAAVATTVFDEAGAARRGAAPGRVRRGRPARAPPSRVCRPRGRPSVWVVVFGLVLATMNALFYQSLERIPLGVAVTVEFIGPLAVAVALSRRLLDLAWVASPRPGLRCSGARRSTSTRVGLAFALGAGVCWAVYIVVGKCSPHVAPPDRL